MKRFNTAAAKRRMFKKVSEKAQAKKFISTLYRPFSISNVVGNIAPQTGWTTRLSSPPKVGYDDLGRSIIDTADRGPVYLVAQGTDRDFRKLSPKSGFEIDGLTTIKLSSNLRCEGGVRAHIVILEFDKNRTRIGELTLGPNVRVKGALLAETAYVLPTIRLAGEGTLTVEWLSMELSELKISSQRGSTRTEMLQASELAGTDARFSALKEEINRLKSGVLKLDSEFDEFHLSAGVIPANARGVNGGTSRDDGEISAARESFAREFLVELANTIPTPAGSHHFEKIPVKIGIITDEYMFNFYKDVFEEVFYLSPDNYREVLAENTLDAVFYVTCWKGMEEEEWKGVKFREKPMTALSDILDYAESNGIATIFQSIEDPSNFEYFLPIAEKFQWVFTSDSDVVSNYKAELGHDRVFYGEYGANPMVNNPVGAFRHNFNKAFFAGSYPERYPERCADMNLVFSAIPDSSKELVILDRNFGSQGFEFPAEVQSSILGPVSHSTLQKMHKLFRFSLNFNSIKNSPTMCAMRVYELQAQGKPIISNYARSVFNQFPGIRIIAHEMKIAELTSNDPYFEELESANKLMTQLFANKSSFHVVSSIAEKVGLPTAPSRAESILVIAFGDLQVVENKLSYQRSIEADLISHAEFISGNYDIDSYGYIAGMSDEIEYEPDYLRSRLNVFVYTDSLFATQYAQFHKGQYTDGLIHEYTNEATQPEFTMVSTDAPGIIDFFATSKSILTGNGYAADPFGIGYTEYLSASFRGKLAENPKLSVIVPVYNNGTFLETKCIPSLRKNDLWVEMEILLIDDGSTEKTTLEVCKNLEGRYKNIKFFSFEDGGSGSASRPRNKGVEIAQADLIAYLDPDNEISPGGYDHLYDEFVRLNESGVRTDLVSGYQVRVAETTRFTGRHTAGETRVVESANAEFFEKGKFPVVSTQAAVIRKSLLLENDIKFVEKAAGQDTLYGWQVLAYAENAAFVDDAYILYFAEREDSVTNQVAPKYFEKCLILEKSQVAVLKDLKLFETYRDGQFENFMRNWYLEKLRDVEQDKQAEAMESLRKISDLYGVKLSNYIN